MTPKTYSKRTSQLPTETPRQWLRRLRKLKKLLEAELDAMPSGPPPDILSDFRQAIAPGKFSEKFDIRATSPKPKGMSLPLQTIADSYGVSRQTLHSIVKANRLSKEDLLDPDRLFQVLLRQHARSLRSRLCDPSTREAIKQSLSTN